MKIKHYEYYVGIDPDVTKSGVALWNRLEKKLYITNLSFFELFDYLKDLQTQNKAICAIIEAGRLNLSNWHLKSEFGAAVSSQIGKRTGANHETEKKIEEMCIYLKIPFELVRPTSSKLDAKTFKAITKYEGRTNQDERDAAMLVFGK
jgi:hypothetical protein